MSNLLTERKLTTISPAVIENTKTVGLAILFAIITAISSKIEIPVSPVPFTFQTMAVILSGIILGKRTGFLSQIMYLGMGALGLPVFAHTADAAFGPAAFVGPTGGYLLAFPVAAFLAGTISGAIKNYIGLILSFAAGELLILCSGMLFLNSFYFHDLAKSFALGVAPFLIWTAAKIALGTGTAKAFIAIKNRISR